MERTDAPNRVELSWGAAATTPPAVWYWFAFSYWPPALLAGREARTT